jgi:UDP-hydrolysing UDP-N-acetyl-D-glucosamine 2-epimerase
MHLSPRFGQTIDELKEDGVHIDSEVAWLSSADASDPPPWRQAGLALAGIGDTLDTLRPDVIVLVGDRYETAAAAVAATIAGVPIAHIHGGEETLGALDDALRHAITKLAHLHLAASEDSAQRLRALGEDAESIHVVGPPGVDNLFRADLPTRAELEADLGIELRPPVVIATVHPATRVVDPLADVRAVIAAIHEVSATYVITLPNSDPTSDSIREELKALADASTRVVVEALGARRYWGLMRMANAMLGNSSSGLIEAPALGLSVVNVGERQAGRNRAREVVDVPSEAPAVAHALRHALASDDSDPALRYRDPLLDGRAGERAARVLLDWVAPSPLRKRPVVVR